MPDVLQDYYNYLKTAKADVPESFQSFKSTLSDSNVAKSYHKYLLDNKFDAPESFDDWAFTLGLKKKDVPSPSPTPKGISSVPSSGTLSPLEIPRPQGQSEKVRIPAPTKKPKTIDEAVQADKFRNESRLAGMYNTALNSVSKAVGGFTNLMNMAQDMVSGVYGVERGIQAATGYNPSQEKQRKTAEAITKFIDKARSSASTKEGEQYRISKFDVTNGIGMEDLKALPEIVAQLGSDIGLAIPTGGASFAAQGYQRGLDEIDALPNADKIGEGTRQFVGLSYGIIDGVLEKFALDKILKNSGATKKIRSQVLKEVTDNLVKSGEKKVTKEAVQKLVTESTNKIANKLKNAGLTALKGAGIEGGTEALQSGLSAGVKYAANKLEGKEIFDEYELQESTKKDLLNSLVLGGVFGGALGGISGAATNLDNYIKNKVGEAQNEADIQTIIDEVALKTQSGEISETEAQEILPKVEQYKEIAKTIPSEVPAQNKGEVIAAIAERQEMEQTLAEKQKEVESTDPAFRKEKEQELNLLTELIEEKNNEIKELASQPIQPEEQITTEEQFKEPIVETVEEESQVIPLQEQQKSQDITLQKEDKGKISVEILSSEEPPMKDGVRISTLSGMTEAERIDAIEARKKETKVSDKVLKTNALVMEAKSYFDKGGRYQNSTEGRNKLNELRNKARALGLEIDTTRNAVVRKKEGSARVTKVVYNSKAEGDAIIEEGAKVLTERDRSVQEVFEELLESDVFLDIAQENKTRMSASQVEATIKDILDGIPSKRANRYLDMIEKAIQEDAFPIYDKTFGELSPRLSDIREQLGVKREVVGEPIDEKALMKFLEEESQLTPQEEQELLDNVENLLYEYETINERGTEAEVSKPKSESEARVSTKAEPITETKQAEPTKSIKYKFKDIADINLSDNPEVVKKREVTKYLKNNPEIADVVKNFRKVTDYLEAQGELKKSSPDC